MADERFQRVLEEQYGIVELAQKQVRLEFTRTGVTARSDSLKDLALVVDKLATMLHAQVHADAVAEQLARKDHESRSLAERADAFVEAEVR